MDESTFLLDRNSSVPPYDQAWKYMVGLAFDLEERLGLPMEEWGNLTMVRVGLMLTDGIEAVMPSSDQIFYRVTDAAAELLVEESELHPDAFDAAQHVVNSNIWNWQEMPIKLRAFAVAVLDGRAKRPKQPGGGVKNMFIRWQIYSGCQTANLMFGLPLTRQDHEEPSSAADLMANIASEYGYPVTYNTVRDWLLHKQYASFRNRCDGANNYLKDKLLFQIGVKKHLR